MHTKINVTEIKILVVKVRLLSYLAHVYGMKITKIPKDIKTVNQALQFLASENADLAEIFQDTSPNVSIIADGRTVQLPRDGDKIVEQELVISPIIAGG